MQTVGVLDEGIHGRKYRKEGREGINGRENGTEDQSGRKEGNTGEGNGKGRQGKENREELPLRRYLQRGKEKRSKTKNLSKKPRKRKRFVVLLFVP